MDRAAGRCGRGRAPRRRAALGCAWLALALSLASPAKAFIPEADRTMKAIAAANRASGRNQALRLTLTMRVGDREPVARGELISHPTGLARLELRGYSGRHERYLLSGRELMATRDGRVLESPRPLLQPFFLMQPESEATLRAALETYGVISDAIGLAPCGEEDCFVIGDPRLAAPLPTVLPDEDDLALLDDALTDPEAERSSPLPPARGDEQAAPLEGPELAVAGSARMAGVGRDALLPRIWVETRDLEVRRIDRADGVFMIVGPMVAFEKLRVPAWLEIHEPEAEPIRFEIDSAVAVNAPPKAFSRRWLTSPVEPDAQGGAAASPGAPESGGSP
jgi:hypothetical protein